MSDAREKMKQQLRGATEQSQNLQNQGYAQYETYFTLPENVELWNAKGNEKGIEHYIDIIPFEVGDNFPDKMFKNPFKKGDFTYVLDLWVHRNVGPENATVLCPKSNYRGEECPLCESMAEKQKNEPDEEKRKKIWVEMKPYRRTMYNILCYDSEEEEAKGIQIYEVSHFFMEAELNEQSRATRGRECITFADPWDGKQVAFKIFKKGSGKEQTLEYKGHKFEDRIDPVTKKKYEISNEILDQAVCLDGTLKRLSYDDILALMKTKKKTEDEAPQAEEKEEQPARTRRGLRSAAPVEEKVSDPTPTDEEPPWKDDGPMDDCPKGTFGKDCMKLEICEDCPEERFQNCKIKRKELEGEAGGRRRSLRRGE